MYGRACNQTVLLIDGQHSEQISASDRGLQYGDGLFETIAVVNGEPRLWERHMARLELGEQRLKLPPQDKQRLLNEARTLISPEAQAVLKLVITRGRGGRGYRPVTGAQTTRILSMHPWPDYPTHWYVRGIALRICHTRIGRSLALAGLKHLNRLEQVLARQEWDDPEVPEGLMLDERGCVIAGTQSNLFLVSGGKLITPDLSHAGVAGILREQVLNVAHELDIETRIADVGLADVRSADALFITNSLIGVCPVASLEGQKFDPFEIPDSLTQRVQSLSLGSGLSAGRASE